MGTNTVMCLGGVVMGSNPCLGSKLSCVGVSGWWVFKDCWRTCRRDGRTTCSCGCHLRGRVAACYGAAAGMSTMSRMNFPVCAVTYVF